MERINELKQKVEEQEKIIVELSNTPGNEGKQAILETLSEKQKQVNIINLNLSHIAYMYNGA